MRRGLLLLLALSIGFNIGLLVVRLGGGGLSGVSNEPPHRPPHRGDIQERQPILGSQLDLSTDEMIDNHLARMTKHLRLDDDQREAIDTSLRELLPMIRAQQQRAHEARRALAEYYASPDLDPGRFRELIAGINHAQAMIDSLVGEAMYAEARVLTSEQRGLYFDVIPWRSPPPSERGRP